MKPTSINVQITKSPKQFEAVRLGMEATVDAGETVEEAIKAATAQLNELYAEMYAQSAKPAQTAEKPATNAKEPATEKPQEKERLTFEDKRVQQLVTRIERAPQKAQEIIEKAKQWFDMDEKVLLTLELAASVA